MIATSNSSQSSASDSKSWWPWANLTFLAVLTLILCFTFLSLKSFNSPLEKIPSFSYSSPTTNDDNECSQASKWTTTTTKKKNIMKSLPELEESNSKVYKNWEVFRLNYEDMENNFKVYIYPIGRDNETYFHPPQKAGKYASELFFFNNIRESRFRTEDPDKADLFFIPISSLAIRGLGHSYGQISRIVRDYVEELAQRYPYWNRTLGSDHFIVTCHDVGVRATRALPDLMKNSIRVVCSPSYRREFVPHKDVALPQLQVPFALPARDNDLENRTTLGFWAGLPNSNIRKILAQLWQNDTELDISSGHLSKNEAGDAAGPLEYQNRIFRSKYCICPHGSQVNSARIGDSIHYGCVPVILSDYYDLPFNDVLDWKRIAVILRHRDVYQLKQILKAIPNEQYLSIYNNLAKVRKHFEWNRPPVKYDTFHMIMYELWLRHSVIRY